MQALCYINSYSSGTSSCGQFWLECYLTTCPADGAVDTSISATYFCSTENVQPPTLYWFFFFAFVVLSSKKVRLLFITMLHDAHTCMCVVPMKVLTALSRKRFVPTVLNRIADFELLRLPHPKMFTGLLLRGPKMSQEILAEIWAQLFPQIQPEAPDVILWRRKPVTQLNSLQKHSRASLSTSFLALLSLCPSWGWKKGWRERYCSLSSHWYHTQPSHEEWNVQWDN